MPSHDGPRLVLGIALALAACAHSPASAQSYPTKAITIVVPLAAGTGMDTIARLYGEQLAQALGKPVIVDNRPGASMMLATVAVASAPADATRS
jgi:tripartite-type tricarboxylate transporter receptor subunit TctC